MKVTQKYRLPQTTAVTQTSFNSLPIDHAPRSTVLILTLIFVKTMRWPASPWPTARPAGLGVAAMSYVAIDYLRYLSPTWHSRLQPALWFLLALIAITRIPFYKHWSAEFRAAIPFVASMVFMLSALLFEALSVRFVTAVLGLDWHR